MIYVNVTWCHHSMTAQQNLAGVIILTLRAGSELIVKYVMKYDMSYEIQLLCQSLLILVVE